ncbi:4-hydroxy-tetrahydrodipicolinate reductase [Xylella fastidiosa]|uniref:4-hydroxy-tetrahydrodipicolinate reductase n=1 Tax=Xylella fastidiosa TaxID=2371 RepID=UPI0009BDCEA5|nr:4-hydroxy-tetrahydrodipicolinate reductase [Xylella fastidiosa]TNW22021.1 4-hydroxy-tetrahydrodipicolinate reductase [Xylella fastidiosa subsp. pauca]
MDSFLRLLIHGASGRMGQALLRLASEDPSFQVAAAVVGQAPDRHVSDGVPFFAAAELAAVPAFDVAIDFSLPQGVSSLLALCVARAVPLVSGTTGLDSRQHEALVMAGAQIPLVWGSNFSVGMAVLVNLVERAGDALSGWDCDIVESHHVHKQDAPSGSALTLGEAVACKGIAPRYTSLRAGDIVGDHLVQFTGLGERIELVHRATNRDVFARGALYVAQRVVGCVPGCYRVRDLIM